MVNHRGYGNRDAVQGLNLVTRVKLYPAEGCLASRIGTFFTHQVEITRDLAMLETNHAIVEVDESIETFSDTLLARYRLGEPLEPGVRIQVWDRCWTRGDEVLFRGTLRRAAVEGELTS